MYMYNSMTSKLAISAPMHCDPMHYSITFEICQSIAKPFAIIFSVYTYVDMRTDYLTIVFMSMDCVYNI